MNLLRNYILILFLSLTFIQANTYNIRFQPVLATFGTFHGGIEFKSTKNLSYQATMYLDGADFTTFGGTAYYYFLEVLKDGFYTSASVSLGKSSGENIVHTKAALAYQWIWDSFNINLGYHYSIIFTSISNAGSDGIELYCGFAF